MQARAKSSFLSAGPQLDPANAREVTTGVLPQCERSLPGGHLTTRQLGAGLAASWLPAGHLVWLVRLCVWRSWGGDDPRGVGQASFATWRPTTGGSSPDACALEAPRRHPTAQAMCDRAHYAGDRQCYNADDTDHRADHRAQEGVEAAGSVGAGRRDG